MKYDKQSRMFVEDIQKFAQLVKKYIRKDANAKNVNWKDNSDLSKFIKTNSEKIKALGDDPNFYLDRGEMSVLDANSEEAEKTPPARPSRMPSSSSRTDWDYPDTEPDVSVSSTAMDSDIENVSKGIATKIIAGLGNEVDPKELTKLIYKELIKVMK